MKRTAGLLLAAVALLSVLAGCGAAAKPKTTLPGVAAAASDQGIEVRASVNAAEFAPGSVPPVVVEVQNKGKTAVRYIRYDGCDPGIHVWMERNTARTGHFVQKTENPERGCTDAIEFADLQPGGTVKVEYFYRAIPDQPPPGNGEHAIVAVFNRGADTENVRPVAVALKVKVTGGEPRVSQAEALDSAKADPRVAQWLKAHPEVQVEVTRWRSGKWHVLFATKSGPSPHEVEVAVSGVPARVESVTFR